MKKLLIFILLFLSFNSSIFACTDTITVQANVVDEISPGIYIPIYQAKVQNDIYFGITNPFGYTSFTVPNCGSRVFTATHKNYMFQSQTFILPVPDTDYLNMTFVSN